MSIYVLFLMLCLEQPGFCEPEEHDCVEECVASDDMDSVECVHFCLLAGQESE